MYLLEWKVYNLIGNNFVILPRYTVDVSQKSRPPRTKKSVFEASSRKLC